MIKVENNIITVGGISIQFDSMENANGFLLDYISKHGQQVVPVSAPIVEDSVLKGLIDSYGYIEIENLDLSVRAYNCLKRAGINTVEQILKLDYEGVMCIRNLGWRSIVEIENNVNEFIRNDYINWSSQRNGIDII